MRKPTAFEDIKTAPRDGVIEVRHGPDQGVVLARYAGQTQAWIADADPLRRTLHRVGSWRPAPEGQGGAKKAAEVVRAVITAPAASAPQIAVPAEEDHPAPAARPSAIVKPRKKQTTIKAAIVHPNGR
jgi:hypothetical protein